jgi:hypothetical protein
MEIREKKRIYSLDDRSSSLFATTMFPMIVNCQTDHGVISEHRRMERRHMEEGFRDVLPMMTNFILQSRYRIS